jgi:hypothetical protein
VATRASELRGLLLEATRGCDDALLARLGTLASWSALLALWEGGWLGAGKSSVRATCAQIRQRLRAIADSRHPIAALLSLPAGTPVCIEGTIVDAGADELIIDDGSGERAHARSRTGWWDNARPGPQAGDRVTVVGFADSEVDPTRAPAGPRALPRRVVIRAAHLPVIAHLGALALPTRAR